MLLDLALPDVLVQECKVYYARSMGPAFKAPPPASAEGDAAWWIDEQQSTVLVGRLDQQLAKMTHAEEGSVLDDLQDLVDDRMRVNRC